MPQRLVVRLALDKRDLKGVQRNRDELVKHGGDDGEPPREHELPAVRSLLIRHSDAQERFELRPHLVVFGFGFFRRRATFVVGRWAGAAIARMLRNNDAGFVVAARPSVGPRRGRWISVDAEAVVDEVAFATGVRGGRCGRRWRGRYRSRRFRR